MKEMCEGHLIPRRPWYKLDFIQHYECEACVPDRNNVFCPDYKPIGAYIVREGDNESGHKDSL